MTCILLSIERYQFFSDEDRGTLYMGCSFIEYSMSGNDTCMISGVQVRPRGRVKLAGAIPEKVLTRDCTCLTIPKICLK